MKKSNNYFRNSVIIFPTYLFIVNFLLRQVVSTSRLELDFFAPDILYTWG